MNKTKPYFLLFALFFLALSLFSTEPESQEKNNQRTVFPSIVGAARPDTDQEGVNEDPPEGSEKSKKECCCCTVM